MKEILLMMTLFLSPIILIACGSSIEIDNELVGIWKSDGSIDEVRILNTVLEFNTDGTGMLTVNAEDLTGNYHMGDFSVEFEWSVENGKIALEIITDGVLGSRERLWLYNIDDDILIIHGMGIGNAEDVFEREGRLFDVSDER